MTGSILKISKVNIRKIEQTIDYSFKDKLILQRALTHPSFDEGINYESLEFLGDSILNFVITSELITRFSLLKEGQLSKMKSYLVSKDVEVSIAQDISIGEYILMSESESATGGKYKQTISENALEALIGAVYLDSNIKYAKDFILKFWSSYIDSCQEKSIAFDPKSRLQEIAYQRWKSIPHYQMLDMQQYSAHHEFKVLLSLEGMVVTGHGSNKKEAEKVAAKLMLNKITSKTFET